MIRFIDKRERSLLSTIADQQSVMCTTSGEHRLISSRCQQKCEKQIERIDGLTQ